MYLNEDQAMEHEEEAEEDARAQSLLQTELDALGLDPSSERVVALRVSIRALTNKIRKTADVAKLHLKDKDQGRAAPSS